MINTLRLLELAKNFHKYAQSTFGLLKSIVASKDLISRIDNIDISNEKLYTQFSKLEELYKLIDDSVRNKYYLGNNVDSEVESLNDLIEIREKFDVLAKMIMESPYLDLEVDDDRWEESEDFSAADFSELVSNMSESVDEMINKIADKDVFEEVVQNRFQEEFGDNKNVQFGDAGVTFTGNKSEQQKGSWKDRNELLKLLRKTNPNHHIYQAAVRARRAAYERMKSDPERYARYKEKAALSDKRKRSKWKQDADRLTSELLNKNLLPFEIETKTKKLQELKDKISQKKYQQSRVEKAKEERGGKGVKTISNDDPLSVTIKLFKEKLNNQKMGMKKTITDVFLYMQENKSKVENELKLLEAAELTGNITVITAAKKKLNAAINAEAEKDIKIVDYVNDRKIFLSFIDKVQELETVKILDKEDILNEAVPFMKEIVAEGKSLIDKFSVKPNFFSLRSGTPGIVDFVKMINNKVENKLKLWGVDE